MPGVLSGARRWGLCCVTAAILCVPAGHSALGYFVGVRGDMGSTKVVDESQHFWGQKETKFSPKGVTLFTGYMYSPFGLALSGQVYFGFRTHEDPKAVSDDKTARRPVFWSRWNCGAEVLVGKSLSLITVYGLAGTRLSFMQMRGSIMKKGDKEELLFYGKDKTTLEKVSFNKQQPPHNVVLNWTLGGGIRVTLVRGLFVGFEARYAFGNKRPLHMKVTTAENGQVGSVQKIKETFTLGKGPVYSVLLGATL